MTDSSDPMDCSSPGSSVYGISQARILEWVAIFFYSKEYIHKLKKNKNLLWKSTVTKIELAGNYLYLILLIYPQIIANILVGFPGNSVGKETSCSAGALGQKNPLEKRMATHSSILAWRTPWKEEPGKLQSVRSQESDTT